MSHEKRRKRERAQRNTAAGRHPREVLLTVPNEPLRERYLWLLATRQVSSSEVARNLGWMQNKKGRVSSDTARLKRALGLAPSQTTHVIDGERVPVKYVSETLDYEVAVKLTLTLGVDPAVVGV